MGQKRQRTGENEKGIFIISRILSCIIGAIFLLISIVCNVFMYSEPQILVYAHRNPTINPAGKKTGENNFLGQPRIHSPYSV